MTGYGTSVSKVGYPDAGFATMPEMIENANNVQQTVDVPVVADADNGFGDAKNTIRTVREYVRTGVAGIHIEDQRFPKRCGHVKGKQVVSRDQAIGKFRAATDVRDDLDEEFVVIARTDARGAPDGSLNEAIERANAYCDAGADIAFVEGPEDEGEVAEIADRVEYPLLYNYGTRSPRLDLATLESYGYDVAIYASLTLRPSLIGMFSWLDDFARDGVEVLTELEAETDTLPIEGYHEFFGFDDVVDWEETYLPPEDQDRYEQSVGDDIR